LQEDVEASAIKKPTQEDIDIYSSAIARLYPVLEAERVWGAADGLKISIQGNKDYIKQNRNFNGWLHGHFINSVFVFAADGKIRICSLNSPGCWHDSTISDYGLYKRLDEVFVESGGKVVVDSAFKLESRPCLLRSAQQDPIGAPEGVSLNRAATSVRQLSEWGMRMIQAQFPRLKDPLVYEENGERRVILSLMTRIYNFNVSKVGINQILNVYMREKEGNYTYFGGNMIDANANNLF
jgi:DDE superfamily endonuclease